MEYDLLNRPHPHPLLFEEAFNGDMVVCSRCRLPLDSPAFSCSNSDCNFHIHESCVDLPPKSHTRFHPQHPYLLLQLVDGCCNVCGQTPKSSSSLFYQCSKCYFRIDTKCAIMERSRKVSGVWQSGKYVHYNHSHPLELSTQSRSGGIKKVVCVLCKLLIESGSSTYFCSQCDDVHFHKECAELPCEVHYRAYHNHPLVLQFVDENDPFKICNSCRGPCRKLFVYGCTHVCKFFLHIECLQSFNHEHKFDKMIHIQMSFNCQICGEQCLDEYPWMCDTCHVLVHKKCAEFPSILSTTEHEHDLTFNFFPPLTDNILCQICGGGITYYAVYTCSICSKDFTVHLKCAKRHRVDSPFTPVLAPDHDFQQPSSFHDHGDLKSFLPGDIGGDIMCDGCMKCLSVSAPSYRSDRQCDLFLHEECAKLPRTIKPTRLHPHLLTLISIPDFIFACEACSQPFHGFAYHCKTCFSTLDVRCATMKIPLKHQNHHHPLYLCEREEITHYGNCDACRKKIVDKLLFRCSQCSIYLDIACAMLPVVVSTGLDAHSLNLTFVEEQRSDEYYCDICEEEREYWRWFYSCEKCSFAAHPRCTVGEFPYVKSMMHESHKHPLILVTKKFGEVESSGSNFAFQCHLSCNFSVDAMETSYNFTNRNVFSRANKYNFTNRNVFSRANKHYKHPIQDGRIRINFGPYGGRGGRPWRENVFSTIRAFTIYHDKWIHSFQIRYEKNGELIWSMKHSGDGGHRSEVVFDHPNEYLVSIRGYYSDTTYWEYPITVVVRSLTLQTNKRSHGPYGQEDGAKFSFPTGTNFSGLYGTSGGYLDSIGPYAISEQ